jgi:hypothetical protein
VDPEEPMGLDGHYDYVCKSNRLHRRYSAKLKSAVSNWAKPVKKKGKHAKKNSQMDLWE